MHCFRHGKSRFTFLAFLRKRIVLHSRESRSFFKEEAMLVNAKEMLDKALAGHYEVPQFNINNLEWTKSILLACEEVKSPVILGVSEGA